MQIVVATVNAIMTVGFSDARYNRREVFHQRKNSQNCTDRYQFDEDDDLAYYEPGFPKDLDAYYAVKLTRLVYGEDMDAKPGTIPIANIERAGKVLERWRSSRPESDRQIYERGWKEFLGGSYTGAITFYRQLADRIDAGKVTDPLVQFDTYLDMGRSYDMLNQRANALTCNHRVEALLVGTPWEPATAFILQDYETVPFHYIRAQ